MNSIPNSHPIPLSRQLDLVFREIRDELSAVSSGTLFIHIRNNMIGKFGIRHLPIIPKNGKLTPYPSPGLSQRHQDAFRLMVIEALKHRRGWTHGEIQVDFCLRQNVLHASIVFESNYNMANLIHTGKS